MVSYYGWIIAVITLLASYYVVRAVNLSSVRSRLRQRTKCQDPRRYAHRDLLFGLDLLLENGRSAQAHCLMESTKLRYEKYGPTFQSHLLGTTIISTIDPKNLQAVHALDFDGYGLEPARLPTAGLFMGRSIFTTDGPFWEHSRALVKPIFAKAQFADLNTLELYLKQMIDLIPKDGSTVDILPLLSRLVSTPGCMEPRTRLAYLVSVPRYRN